MSKILAIESNCDETACAVVVDGHLVLADQVATQIEIHKKYGGVVPELASRNHMVDIIPVVQSALEESQSTWDDIDGIAVTRGPGLVGSLLVGVQMAKTLAYAKHKPLYPIHHIHGHLSAVALHKPGEPEPELPTPPFVALAVSGGHSALYVAHSRHQLELVAQTRDDAAGEAFAKLSRMLGLGYPGGPIVERGAAGGDPFAFRFTPPKFKDHRLGFSFSGLKTAVLTILQHKRAIPQGQELADLLASFQRAVCQQLTERTVELAQQYNAKDAVMAGGVACNKALRAAMQEGLSAAGVRLHLPRPRWCTDNAAMIGAAAYGVPAVAPDKLLQLNATGTWRIEEAYV